MYLHEDKEKFKDIVEQVADASGRAPSVIEKDYYITLILRLLTEKLDTIVFKGGTSLSKGFQIINRFSEDIDITFSEHIGEARRKKLKHVILKGISRELGMPISNFDNTQSDRDYNAYFFCYNSAFGLDDECILSSVKLETALGSYAFPTKSVSIGNYIGDYLLAAGRGDLAEQYSMDQFEMKLQALERTYIDKIFAICDYYMQGRSKRCSRHLYDLFKLTPEIIFDNDFKLLFKEVREHRAKMGICPSAESNVNVPDLIREICEKDFYKEDYHSITSYFIDDMAEYQDVIDCIKTIAKNISDINL